MLALSALVVAVTACSNDQTAAPGDTVDTVETVSLDTTGPGTVESGPVDSGPVESGTTPSDATTPGTAGVSSAGTGATTDAASATSSPDPTDTTTTPDGSAPTTPDSMAVSSSATTAAGPTTTAGATTTTAIPTTTVDLATPPVVDAVAYAVFDTRSGTFLAQSEADAPRPVGSLMKLLTAYVAYNAGNPTRVIPAPDGLVLSEDESTIGIRPGQELARDLLIRAMLKASANDAARMLALDIAGSEAAFAELMNAAAVQLNLPNTRAVNVTGLDAEGQYSSANDITRLGVLLMANPSFQIAVRDPTAELNGQAFPNTNDLIGTYPGADGIKTGHTTNAGWCVLASATRENRRIIVAVLGASTEEARDAAATALLNWGFSQP